MNSSGDSTSKNNAYLFDRITSQIVDAENPPPCLCEICEDIREYAEKEFPLGLGRLSPKLQKTKMYPMKTQTNLKKGDRVRVFGYFGIVQFVGRVEGKHSSKLYAGVRIYDDVFTISEGRRLYTCPKGNGMLVSVEEIERLPTCIDTPSLKPKETSETYRTILNNRKQLKQKNPEFYNSLFGNPRKSQEIAHNEPYSRSKSRDKSTPGLSNEKRDNVAKTDGNIPRRRKLGLEHSESQNQEENPVGILKKSSSQFDYSAEDNPEETMTTGRNDLVVEKEGRGYSEPSKSSNGQQSLNDNTKLFKKNDTRYASSNFNLL